MNHGCGGLLVCYAKIFDTENNKGEFSSNGSNGGSAGCTSDSYYLHTGGGGSGGGSVNIFFSESFDGKIIVEAIGGEGAQGEGTSSSGKSPHGVNGYDGYAGITQIFF